MSPKKVVILVADLYQDLEVWYPCLRLKEAGHESLIAGPEAEVVYKSKHGYPIKSEIAIKEVNVDRIDGVIIPGGYAPDILRRYPESIKLVKDVYEKGKIIAAICHGGWLLASARIIAGRTVTSFFAIKDDLENAGANYVDSEVVVDGNIITSRMPEDLPLFMTEILRALQEYKG